MKLSLITCIVLCLTGFSYGQSASKEIQLVKTAPGPYLQVDGKPFLIRGGELGNSTASDMKYLRTQFAQLKGMHLNTVLAPVYWELIEPRENEFDFRLVDSLILEARNQHLKLILLWFGTWKNSMSCYAPIWMKTNAGRFPRTQDNNKISQEIFSVFGKETLEADKKAFTRLMTHIKKTDQDAQTVIMVQVENEIGMLPTPREYSVLADKKYRESIPASLTDYLKKNKSTLSPELMTKWTNGGNQSGKSWTETFGDDIYTEEIFQAWYYARYANEVARAGKQAYHLPMFVNAALPRAGRKPGEYPSAGPLPHLKDIWNAAAPDIDMLSPDFYNPDTKQWCDLYNWDRNLLFVPEMQFDMDCGAKALFIIGHYRAIGFSPFSIESASAGKQNLTKSYAILKQLEPFIYSPKRFHIEGILLDKGNGKSIQQITMGNYQISISHDFTLSWSTGFGSQESTWPAAGGIIIQTAADEFLVAGNGIVLNFSSTLKDSKCNFASVDEVEFIDGNEVPGRRMNGDQDHQGRHVRFSNEDWGIQKVKLYLSPKQIDQ